MRKDTIEKIERFIDIWPESDNLRDAHKKANTGINDTRAMQRFRVKAEKYGGVELPSHNSSLSTRKSKKCPSNLDLSKARKFKKYVITSCTNDTEIESGFLKSLKLFCDHHEAQLIIIPIRYKNPSAMNKADDYSWDSSIFDYVLNDKIYVGSNLIINGEFSIAATAIKPLSSMEEISYGRNAVYGHPRVHMMPIPTHTYEMTRFMHTTGSLCKKNYSNTKQGGKAEFHHSVGALFVNVFGDFHYPMQLNYNGDGFHYMNEYWSEKGMTNAGRALGLVSGDIHADWECKKNTNKTNQLMDCLDVETHVLNDLHNHTIGSHHNTPRVRYQLAMEGKIYVEDEMQLSVDYVRNTAREKNIIVGSNHHDHADKWLANYKEKEDPHNAQFASWLKANMYGSDMNALETFFYYSDTDDFHYEFISRKHPYMIGDSDVSQHGDKGVNGARGSTAAYAKLCRKIIHDHTHTPMIIDGAYCAGFSFDITQAGYLDGYSTWAQADIIIYADGKRSTFFYGPNCNPPQLKGK